MATGRFRLAEIGARFDDAIDKAAGVDRSLARKFMDAMGLDKAYVTTVAIGQITKGEWVGIPAVQYGWMITAPPPPKE